MSFRVFLQTRAFCTYCKEVTKQPLLEVFLVERGIFGNDTKPCQICSESLEQVYSYLESNRCFNSNMFP